MTPSPTHPGTGESLATEGLLPCPFCDFQGHIIDVPSYHPRWEKSYRPQCKRCGANHGEFVSYSEAKTAWNRRPAGGGKEECSACPDLLAALKEIESALRKDARDKTISGDAVEYHLDGQTMYHAINKARSAIARAEGRE